MHDGMIFGRNVANPILGSREPFVHGVAEHRFDLRADVQPLALNTKLRDIADGRDLLDEHAVFDFGFGASTLRADFLRDVAAHADGAAIGHGGYSHFHWGRGPAGLKDGGGAVPTSLFFDAPPDYLVLRDPHPRPGGPPPQHFPPLHL